MDIKKLLGEEIESELGELAKVELASDTYKGMVDGTTKLIDRYIELERLEIEARQKSEERRSEDAFRIEQAKKEQPLKWLGIGVTVFGIVTQACLTVWGTKSSFEFEKEGTITTTIGRGFISSFIPKKR